MVVAVAASVGQVRVKKKVKVVILGAEQKSNVQQGSCSAQVTPRVTSSTPPFLQVRHAEGLPYT